MKRKPLTLLIAAILLIIFVLMLFVYQVRLSQVAVVTRFGKVVDVQTNAGPGLRWPYPIEQVFVMDQRVQNFQDNFEQIKLHDQNIIFVSLYMGYRISEPDLFFRNFLNGAVAEAQPALNDLVRSAKSEVIGRHDFSDFVSTGPGQMKFTQIEHEILAEVQKRLSEKHYGVEVKFLQIQKIGLPESVTQNVFDRMTAERQTYIAKIQSEGELEATKIRSAADSAAAKLLYEADAQAFTIRGQGEAQMMKSLEVMQKNPDLAAFNMQISALEQFLARKTTLVLDMTTSPLQWLRMGESANTNTNK
ncbi:MAG TPA: protease modulator HflC [Verrucomicrobiae bacterium]|jgi:membrane protease subunit HflC